MSNLTAMYAADTNSPFTTTSSQISPGDTSISVTNAALLPGDVPYLLTLGYDKAESETVLVTTVVSNTLTVTRGVDGAALTWDAGTKCARVLTAKDINDLQTNIGTLNDEKMEISGGALENYSEKLITLTGTSVTIDLATGNCFTQTLSGATTYTITNALSGKAHSFSLVLKQGASVYRVTYPASVKWDVTGAPDLSTANKTYIITFLTIDGGTTWYGLPGGTF